MKRMLLMLSLLLAVACSDTPEYPGIDRSDEEAFNEQWSGATLYLERANDTGSYTWTLLTRTEGAKLYDGKWSIQQNDEDPECYMRVSEVQDPLYTDGDTTTIEGRASVSGFPASAVSDTDTRTRADRCDAKLCYQPAWKEEGLELDPICDEL